MYKLHYTCILTTTHRSKHTHTHRSLTLQPADLCSGAVALLVLGGDAEDHGWPRCAVDVGVAQMRWSDRARGLGAAVDADEGQFTPGCAGGGRTVGAPTALPHGQVHAVLQDFARWRCGRLPADVHVFRDLNRR